MLLAYRLRVTCLATSRITPTIIKEIAGIINPRPTKYPGNRRKPPKNKNMNASIQ